MYRKFISFALIAVFIFSITSCGIRTTEEYLTEEEAPTIEAEKAVWITTKDSSEYKVTNPKIQDSKVVGLVNGKVKEIEFSEIVFVKIKKNDKTLVLGTAAGGVAIAMFIGASTLPEACGPFVYSFDGKEFVLDSEPYGGAILKERTGYAKLNYLVPVDRKYQLRMTNELNETQYTDELKLLVIEHPVGIDIVPDVTGEIHAITSPVAPVAAHELPERDILHLVKMKDDQLWGDEPFYENPYDERANARKELILEFPKPKNAKTARLVMNVCNTLYSTYKAREFLDHFGDLYPIMGFVRSFARKGFVRFDVEVWEDGRWKNKGCIRGASPYLPRDQIAILNVSKIKGDSLKLRLNLVDGFWRINSAIVDYSEDVSIRVREIEVAEAVNQKGEDIREAMRADDDNFYVTEKGDYAKITFNEPPPVPNMARSFILKARGYYKIHTSDLEPIRKHQTSEVSEDFGSLR
ncbi:hypothetical protein FJZ31_11060 [Candidatus Poribacteria bacterium]|nr:hypothetical protein [Candidatus Poribacteria bacterium]